MSMIQKIETVIAVVIGSFLAFILVLAIVWLSSIYWNTFPLGVKVFMGACVFIPSYAISAGLIFLTIKGYRLATERQVIPAMEDGFYVNDRGRLKGYGSLRGQTPLKQLGTHVEEVIAEVPRLTHLLQDEMLVNDADEVLLGYRPNGIPRYGQWPSVFAMLGIGNSGKSVSMVLFIVIAILRGYEVVVCDPHHTKERSIYKKLKVLDGYITFAFTTEEILRESIKFSQELKAKKEGIGLENKKLLVYDELTSLVKRNKEIGKQIVTVVEEGSQEGMGYNHNVMLACHGVTEDAIGDVAIRNALNGVFVHRVDTDQSKYVLKDKRFNKKSGNLPSGHVFYRDEIHETEYLVMPFSDASDTTIALKTFQDRQLLPMGRVVDSRLAYNNAGAIEAPIEQRNKHLVNSKQEDKQGVNTLVATIQEDYDTVYVDADEIERETDTEAINSVKLNSTDEELARLIHRMRNLPKPISHREIARVVGLYGTKYKQYQELCTRYNIPLKEEVKESA